jgi:2-oxoglutarate dehydrogenase E1 component
MVNIRTFMKQSRALSKPAGQSDNFINGTSAVFIDSMYDQFLEDPSSVHASWRAYFNNIESDSAEPYQAPPSLGKKDGSGQLGSIDEIINALK